MTNTVKIAEVGETVYFGYKKTPNKITRVTLMPNHKQLLAMVYFVGPRGGEYIGYQKKDGSYRKI